MLRVYTRKPFSELGMLRVYTGKLFSEVENVKGIYV